MVAVSTILAPPCGLYRTTRALPGDDAVGPGLLVSFHDHSDAAVPVVFLPAFSTFNRWAWGKDPHPIRERGWLESLRPLPAEGYYVLPEDLAFDEAKWPASSLVQLGYDLTGGPLLFLAQRKFHRAENTLFFGERGVPIDADRLARLRPLVVYEEPDPDAAGAEARVAR